MKSLVRKFKTIFYSPTKLLLVLMIAICSFINQKANAGPLPHKILFYYTNQDAWSVTPFNQCVPILQSAAAGSNIVTAINVGTTASPCPGGFGEGAWTNYDEVWDMRYKNDNSMGCAGAGFATNPEYFAACWQTASQDYIENHCGNMYIMAENSGFGSRDFGVVQFLITIGAVAGTYTGCCGATTNDVGGSGPTGVLSPPFTGQWYIDFPGAIPDASLNGTSYLSTAAGWSCSGVSKSMVMGWAGAAQMHNLAGCNVGTLFMTWDVSGWFVGDWPSSSAYMTNMYKQIPAWFASHSCVCGFTPTATNTATKTFTFTATNTATNTYTNTQTDTPTPTRTFTNTFTATDTSTPTNTPTASPTATDTFTNTYTSTPTNTKTATPTDTNTFTNTFTSTFTNTYTPTDTPTFTNTFTNTFTATFTNTFTATFTATPTFTDTFVNTPTFTNTFTETPTATVTDTFTNTLTNTDTPTNTFTSTFTNTITNTDTPTNTFTSTFTNTITNTDTPTNTFTSTFTNTPIFTFTFTNTFTLTDTNTVTDTPTATQTFTNTDTSTPTSTPTSGISMGKHVSETQVHSGDTLTYSIGVTVVGNNVTGAVITDTLPAYMTFIAFGSSPAGTTSAFNAGTDQLQWVMPSPLAPGTYNLTYSTQLGTFAPANMALTNFAQLNYSGSGAPITSSVPVTVIGNFTVKINVYNEAGEIVKSITIQTFTQPISNISLSTTNTITTLKGPGSSINIMFNGYVIGTWDGTNNSGLPVTNGQYKIQVDNIGQSGVVTSVAQNATVNRSLANITANVYNAAGELVRTLYYVVDDPIGVSMTNVTLSSNVIKPNLTVSESSNGPNLATVYIQTSGTPVTLTWDGTSNTSSMVSPGEYTIAVHWNNGSGQTTDISRQVLVVSGTATDGIAIAKPNILNSLTTMTTTFDATGVVGAASLKVRIYTLDGELVQMITSATAQATWTASGMASGIYLANVEMDNANGGVVKRQFLKVLVTR